MVAQKETVTSYEQGKTLSPPVWVLITELRSYLRAQCTQYLSYLSSIPKC